MSKLIGVCIVIVFVFIYSLFVALISHGESQKEIHKTACLELNLTQQQCELLNQFRMYR